MFRRAEPLITPEEVRGVLILLMKIEANVDRIAKEVVEDDGEEEEEQG